MRRHALNGWGAPLQSPGPCSCLELALRLQRTTQAGCRLTYCRCRCRCRHCHRYPVIRQERGLYYDDKQNRNQPGQDISKKTALRPVASCSPRPPDVPAAYNVNSSSGCFRPGSFRLGATFFRPDAPGAPWRSLLSNHTPSAKPLPPAAPEVPVRLPPPPEAFRLQILSSQTRPAPSHDTHPPSEPLLNAPIPPPFPPLSSGRFPTTLPIRPVRRTPLAYSPASAGRSPTPLFFALYPPHSSRPPNVIPSTGRYTTHVLPSAWHLSLHDALPISRARFVRALSFSVRTHRVHPGAVCLATIPLAQNPSPLQRRKHPFACLLPQKPFDYEFSPPRRAQLLPMIPPLSLNLSRTLPYLRPFPPLSSGRFPTTSPSFPSAGRPLRILQDLPDVLQHLPHVLQHLPDVPLLLCFRPLPSTLFSSTKCYTVRLASFPTL